MNHKPVFIRNADQPDSRCVQWYSYRFQEVRLREAKDYGGSHTAFANLTVENRVTELSKTPTKEIEVIKGNQRSQTGLSTSHYEEVQ